MIICYDRVVPQCSTAFWFNAAAAANNLLNKQILEHTIGKSIRNLCCEFLPFFHYTLSMLYNNQEAGRCKIQKGSLSGVK